MPEVAEQDGGVVGHGFRRVREDQEINVRRSSHVWFALPEDTQPDAGDDRFVIWGVGALRHREACDDGDRYQWHVQGLGV